MMRCHYLAPALEALALVSFLDADGVDELDIGVSGQQHRAFHAEQTLVTRALLRSNAECRLAQARREPCPSPGWCFSFKFSCSHHGADKQVRSSMSPEEPTQPRSRCEIILGTSMQWAQRTKRAVPHAELNAVRGREPDHVLLEVGGVYDERVGLRQRLAREAAAQLRPVAQDKLAAAHVMVNIHLQIAQYMPQTLARKRQIAGLRQLDVSTGHCKAPHRPVREFQQESHIRERDRAPGGVHKLCSEADDIDLARRWVGIFQEHHHISCLPNTDIPPSASPQ